jgi:hypothetical protein
MAELVDRPQVDACGIEGEAVPVIDAGVFAEAVQEDNDGARLARGPVAVVGATIWVIEERHGGEFSCDPPHMGMATEIRRAPMWLSYPEIPASCRPIAASGIKPLTSPFKEAYRSGRTPQKPVTRSPSPQGSNPTQKKVEGTK